jgi:N6-adenosine-specific RNA methylase IME4
MSFRDIRALNVHMVAALDCALFLWTTGPMVQAAVSVMDAWGFRYVTVGFVWQKIAKAGQPRIGIGRYSRPSVEFCLLGMRGILPVLSHSVRQVVSSVPEHPHSRKPAEVRDRIVELFGDVPRLEMFAREATPGWSTWGLESPHNDAPELGCVRGDEHALGCELQS